MEEMKSSKGFTRREFVTASLAGTAILAASAGLPRGAAAQQGPFVLPPLPYAEDALAPVISSQTIGFHYGKHHKGYVDNLNKLVLGTAYEKMALELAISTAAIDPGQTAIFNNAAQVWNHTFFWNSLKPAGGGKPVGEIAMRIETDFGSYENFRKELVAAALGQFGSGWAWLAAGDSKLKVVKTANAENPLTLGLKPLLTIDVWEHAYYLDYQNRRKDYVEACLDKLLNWDFAEENLLRQG
jgi:superoxide dismutase, Fe-Mn family